MSAHVKINAFCAHDNTPSSPMLLIGVCYVFKLDDFIPDGYEQRRKVKEEDLTHSDLVFQEEGKGSELMICCYDSHFRFRMGASKF